MVYLSVRSIIGIYIFLLTLAFVIVFSNYIVNWFYQSKFNDLPVIKSSPKEWDPLPITRFHIRTSHNSYIGRGMQYGSKASSQAVVDALNLGARCIELDIGFKDGKCVVGHKGPKPGMFSTTTVPFEDVLRVVQDNAFRLVDDPLFIIIDNYSDPNNDNLVITAKSIIETTLPKEQVLNFSGTRVTDSRHFLRDYTLGELRGKIIILGINITPFGGEYPFFEGSLRNRGNRSEDAAEEQDFSFMTRIWTQDTKAIFSFNIDAIPFMNKNFRMVSMNFGMRDYNLLKYLREFGDHGLKLVSLSLMKN